VCCIGFSFRGENKRPLRGAQADAPAEAGVGNKRIEDVGRQLQAGMPVLVLLVRMMAP
jgi:hypothetical protein